MLHIIRGVRDYSPSKVAMYKAILQALIKTYIEKDNKDINIQFKGSWDIYSSKPLLPTLGMITSAIQRLQEEHILNTFELKMNKIQNWQTDSVFTMVEAIEIKILYT